ncbi:hypothetical protein [Rhizobium lentis]|uniref:Uncharacterized protein n=1 Tax=Rhizobium lentis TaxID=1138194 RepID=A0ABS7IBU9_9HYPH|nr:hypothetical protein [Rhizobium lentis]MBX5089367.1 hypothetical protein [Rhizobium lentis]
MNTPRYLSKAFFVAALLACSTAYGHEAPSGWNYPTFCCQGISGPGGQGDCQKINSKNVKPVVGGYQVSIGPGDHMLATKDHVFFIPYKDVKESGDSDFHLCLYPTEDTARCFFAPPMSF